MQTRPETPCEVEKFNRALSQMRLWVERSGLYSRFGVNKRDIPDWAEAALRQHALFYAIESCQSRGGNVGGLGVAQYYTEVVAPEAVRLNFKLPPGVR
jgi:hypothetical protein